MSTNIGALVLDRVTVNDTDESPRQALGRFLRQRREAIVPERVGIPSRRGRRTPGLRREEVAFLADIGVKWYARLEAAEDVHPSTSTLTSIAVALRLSDAELDYMFELAGLQQPIRIGAETGTVVPAPLSALVRGLRGVCASLTDRILTPLQWNPLSEFLHGHSRFTDPVERNLLVRSLYDPELRTYLGAQRESYVFRAVGMLRLNLAALHRSPFASAVYERIKAEPLFQRAWSRRVVASEQTDHEAMIRDHPTVGKLETYAADFVTALWPNLLVRVLSPANAETAAKFDRLEKQLTST